MSKSATFSHPFSALLKAQIDPRIQVSYLIKAVVKYSMNAVIAIYDNGFNVVDILGVATKCIKKCNSYQKHAKRGVKNG